MVWCTQLCLKPGCIVLRFKMEDADGSTEEEERNRKKWLRKLHWEAPPSPEGAVVNDVLTGISNLFPGEHGTASYTCNLRAVLCAQSGSTPVLCALPSGYSAN